MQQRLVLAVFLSIFAIGCMAQTYCQDQNITTVFTNTFDSILVLNTMTFLNGPNNETAMVVFVLDTNSQLWRSYDYGRSWTKQNVFLFNANVPSTLEKSGSTYYSGVRQIIRGANGGIVYFVGVDGRFWSTTDRGESYSSGKVDNFHTWQLQSHPTNPLIAVAFGDTDTCWNSAVNLCRDQIWATDNGGLTWSLVRDNAAICRTGAPNYWDYLTFCDRMNFRGRNQVFISYEAGNDYSLMYLYFETVMDSRTRYATYTLYPATWIMDRDWRHPGVNPIHKLTGIFSFTYDGSLIFTSLLSDNSQVSFDKGDTFDATKFPPPPDFEGIDTTAIPYAFYFTGGSLWAVMDFYDENTDYWWFQDELYFAESADQGNFTYSLANLWELGTSEIGVFFASSRISRASFVIKSSISFDRGATWNPYPEPLNHTYTNCASNCRLQIDPSRAYTQSSIPGIIVANGNVGATVDNNAFKAFISRDGGLTWNQIIAPGESNKTSAAQFTLSEHGGLLTYIYSEPDIHSIFYSFDQGSTMQSCDFLNITDLSPLDIPDPVALVTDPAGETSHIMLFSSLNNKHVLYWFDFSTLISRDCIFPDDYETYVAYGPNGACLSGQLTTYWRLVPGARCHEDDTLTSDQLIVNTTTCECGASDFICDECFYLSDDGTCQFIYSCDPTLTEAEPPSPCPINTTYISPVTGYRKLSASSCLGGIDLASGTRTLNCPGPRPVPPTPVAPTPVAPTPVAPTPVAPTPVAPAPVAPTPAPTPAPVLTPTSTPSSAPSTTPPSTTPSPLGSTPDSSSSDTPLTASVAGIAVGVILGLVVLVSTVILVVFLYKRYKNKQTAENGVKLDDEVVL